MTFLATLATIVGFFLGASTLPQAIKIFQRKSAEDISLTSCLIVEFGTIVWILYGLEIKSFPIVVPNIVGLFSNSLVLLGCFLYAKKKKSRSQQ